MMQLHPLRPVWDGLPNLIPAGILLTGICLFEQKNKGVTRKLVGFEMIDRGIPRQHYKLFNNEGGEIGEVTSGTMSPSLKTGIGMAYVQTAYAAPGNEILVGIRDKMIAAKVVKMPFYKAGI